METIDKSKYNIILLDYTSLYPHVYIQAALLNRKKEFDFNNRPTWNGGGVWKVSGVYYTDEMGIVAKLQRKWFYQRNYYKRKFVLVEEKKVVSMKKADKYIGKVIYTINLKDVKDLELKEIVLTEELVKEYLELSKKVDPLEYTFKICLNTSFGVSDNPAFILLYDMTAAQDCTSLGEQWVKYARQVFKENGYDVAYTDTDSLYILDYYMDTERLLKVKQQIIDYIKSTVPFPQTTFDFELECEIKHLFFFKGDNKKNKIEFDLDEDDQKNKHEFGLLQKNYIYVKKGIFKDPKDALVIKNLGIRKKSTSPLSRKLFWDYLVPQIVEKGIVKFSKTYLKNIILELLEKDTTLMCMRKSVKKIEHYSNSLGGIQAQITKKYGPGIHFLIPNTRGVGVGNSIKLCTLDEFKDRNFTISDIDMSGVWSELSYFIKPQIKKNIFEY